MRVAGRRATQRRGSIARGFLGLLGALVLIDRHGVTRFTHEGYPPVDGAAYEARV
jgi:hypothetical protein